ncbi:hypothetical protein [Flavobacterium maritimum]|uniref:hypothetical protein n=1 Tax=Flavobacterium maritimum TaxID=3149042 RepID=UPI0032B37E6F
MKTSKKEKRNKKFDLEKMKVAKLENIHLINGGYALGFDDPIDTNRGKNGSSIDCNR